MQMLDYTQGTLEFENWIVSETVFSSDFLGKCEAIMYLGNGYLGLRSATEEPYLKETRNMFVNGTFNKAFENEATELPNIADITRMDIRVDGEQFSLEFGETTGYMRQLNLKTAELVRSFEWVSPLGKGLKFIFKRFVSLHNHHLIGMKMEVESLTAPVHISFESGINAQMTNSGTQHFMEGERRIFDKRFIRLVQTTNESGIDVVIHTTHNVNMNSQPVKQVPDMKMDRRKVWQSFEFTLEPKDILEVEKLTTLYTSRDKEVDSEDYSLASLSDHSLRELKRMAEEGYGHLFEAHQKEWKDKVWNIHHVDIDSENDFDQLAMNFSLYHLVVMAPAHDDRMGIAAKGLSGEGYKGHSFWDTELFILPFFIYTNPKIAESLLIYRYRGLAGARKKAAQNGYSGAMYPWEMAWPTDGEVTPVWGDIDIITGKQTKIWSGFIEQHISADIAFAVYQYYEVTQDEYFLEEHGYEIVFETARFWSSRLEWNSEKQQYQINGVIGPDEYKEHVNNNAFTNYMAYFNINLAIRYYEKLEKGNPQLVEKLDGILHLKKALVQWKTDVQHLYLPAPREQDLVIPQDDSYLQLKEIDLAKYKNHAQVRAIYRDYNSAQINAIQVTKQADTLLILYLLEQTFLQNDWRFSKKVKEANFRYYEPRTLHDSSLSLATHAILANDISDSGLSYSLFKKSAEIDLGPEMITSDTGIHAAAISGIWKTVVFGFGGVRLADGKLMVNPRLPAQWKQLKFTIQWQGQAITLSVTQSNLSVKCAGARKLMFQAYGEMYTCENTLEVPIPAAKSS